MKTITIVVADAGRARLLTLQPFVDPRDGGSRLVERANLVDPGRRLPPSELLSDPRPGNSQSPTGVGFTVDDHREDYLRELDRRFASEVMRQAMEIVNSTGSYRLVIVASPRMLGLLRDQTSNLRRRVLDVQVDEVARDLTHESPIRLHRHLVDLGLLPAPRAA